MTEFARTVDKDQSILEIILPASLALLLFVGITP